MGSFEICFKSSFIERPFLRFLQLLLLWSPLQGQLNIPFCVTQGSAGLCHFSLSNTHHFNQKQHSFTIALGAVWWILSSGHFERQVWIVFSGSLFSGGWSQLPADPLFVTELLSPWSHSWVRQHTQKSVPQVPSVPDTSPLCCYSLLCMPLMTTSRVTKMLSVEGSCVCVCASLVPASHGAVIWKAVSTDLNEAQEPGHSSTFLSPSHYQSESGLKSQAQGRNSTLRSTKPEFKSAWTQPPVSFITLTSY